jgi:predicted PurR-regulated permease PerM
MICGEIVNSQGVVEVSKKIGGFSIYFGLMLIFNLYMFFKGRKVAKASAKAGGRRQSCWRRVDGALKG